MHTLQEINALMKTTGDQLFAVLCLGGRERQRERETAQTVILSLA